MTSEWHPAELICLAVCATYLLHSMLWLGAAWAITATVGRSSWSLRERLWREAAEHLCDDWAVDCGINAVALARCLTDVADQRLHRHRGGRIGNPSYVRALLR